MEINPNIEMRELYRSMLPYGAQLEIARKLNVTPVAISGFLKGKINSQRIEKAILKVIAREKTEREKLLKEAGLL